MTTPLQSRADRYVQKTFKQAPRLTEEQMKPRVDKLNEIRKRLRTIRKGI